jgi:hypothetical protein
MITLTAKINLLSGDNKALLLGSDNLFGNNISKDLGSVIGVKKNGSNPFIIGANKIGDGSTFSDGVDYFIGNQLSNDSGIFESSYSFSIKDKNGTLTNLTISFDTESGRHPNKIILDGVEYIDDDPIFTIANLTPREVHSITIDNWNSPKYPLVITGIYAGVSIEVDRRNLISLDRSIFDRSDLKLPSFGIICNTGNIEFNDIDGEIRDYAEQLLLQSGLACEIKLNNTITGASELVAKMETNQWDYDNDNRFVSVSLKDDLEEWQDINVPEISYDKRNAESKPFSWLYEHLWAITNPNYPMQSLDELGEETYNVLTNTYIQYPLLKSGSLWQQWTKLCQVCQLHIFKNSDGIVVCRYNGGN